MCHTHAQILNGVVILNVKQNEIRIVPFSLKKTYIMKQINYTHASNDIVLAIFTD